MRFEDLQEQEQLRRALTEDLISGTFNHAVLITGPAGSGKRTWGRVLARAILCPNRRGAEPCLACGSCRSFDSGNHPGFFYLEPENRKIKIDQLREIRGKFYLEGANRVCLINHADQMTAEAGSSLLKILEDPPPGLYFILLAEQGRRLYSTILSRCRRFSLQPLSAGAVTAILEQRGIVDPKKASLAVRLCKGLPGTALTMAEDPVFEERLQEAAALAGRLATGRLTPREILTKAADLADREDLLLLVEMLYLFFRDGLMRKLCQSEALLVNPQKSDPCLDAASPVALEPALELIHSALKELMLTNVNRRLTVEGLLIQLQRRFSNAQGGRSTLPPGR